MATKEIENFENVIKLLDTFNPESYQYLKGLENRRIILNNEIDASIVEQVMIPLIDMDNDGTGKPIEIYLSSVGGSLFDGMNLCSVIDKLKTPTVIFAPTYCYSMGGLILMAGKSNPNVKKKCFPYSSALIHSGSTYLDGNSHSVRDMFHFHEKMENKIKEYIISHTNITEEEYYKMERTEWYMTAEEMLEKGLVDEII